MACTLIVGLVTIHAQEMNLLKTDCKILTISF